jgi:hypothetical protein
MSEPFSFTINLEQGDFCVVTDTIRQGIPVRVQVLDSAGRKLHEAGAAPA